MGGKRLEQVREELEDEAVARIAQLEEATSEVERLKEALRKIEELTNGGQVIRISELARAALADEKED